MNPLAKLMSLHLLGIIRLLSCPAVMSSVVLCSMGKSLTEKPHSRESNPSEKSFLISAQSPKQTVVAIKRMTSVRKLWRKEILGVFAMVVGLTPSTNISSLTHRLRAQVFRPIRG